MNVNRYYHEKKIIDFGYAIKSMEEMCLRCYLQKNVNRLVSFVFVFLLKSDIFCI